VLDVVDSAAHLDTGGGLLAEVSGEICTFQLFYDLDFHAESTPFEQNSIPECLFVVALQFSPVVLANTHKIGTYFTDEAH
jgi:hypothetical protein